jgi:hypothetical protein
MTRRRCTFNEEQEWNVSLGRSDPISNLTWHNFKPRSTDMKTALGNGINFASYLQLMCFHFLFISQDIRCNAAPKYGQQKVHDQLVG